MNFTIYTPHQILLGLSREMRWAQAIYIFTFNKNIRPKLGYYELEQQQFHKETTTQADDKWSHAMISLLLQHCH
jgi:hypothetical protein